MARWIEKNDIREGPSEEEFLLALGGGGIGERLPVTFGISPMRTQIEVFIDRIERGDESGEAYFFYGRAVGTFRLNPRKVRGHYKPRRRSGSIAWRATKNTRGS